MTNLNKKIKVDLREVVFSREEGKSFCDIFVYEPENIEEQALGNLYIVGEIVNFSENSSYLVNLLASISKKEFYSNSKKSTMESLEASLHKINSMLSDLAEQGNVDWIGNLNMTCCTYKNGELYLSQTGKIKTILIRDGQITDIGKNIINEENPHPFKTFTNIASGELEDGDLILFTTPELFNVFSIDKLRQLASSLDIEELAEIIQNSIEKENTIKTVGLLLMKIEEEKEEKLSHIEIKSQIENKKEEKVVEKEMSESMKEKAESWKAEMVEKVIEHAETTEKTRVGMPKKEEELSLEDIISKYEKRKIKEKDLSGETESKKDSTSDFMDSLDQKSRTKFENLLEKLREIFTITKDKIILPTFKLAKKLIIKLAGVFLKKSESEFEFPQQTKLLSSRKKIILVVFIFIVFILTGGLVFKNYKDSENERLNTYASLLIQAEKKLNKAEIDSIVNPIEARRSLIEAKNILGARNTSLDNKNNYRDLSNKTAILLKEIQKQLDIIDLVNKIENPAVAIDFSQIENIINPKKIFKENKKYYIFDLESKILNGINFDEKKLNNFKIEITGNINLDNLSTLMEKTGEIMLLENSNKIAIFNIDKKTFLYTDIEFAENMSGTKDIDSYSNFMYLLNPDSNQIYKYKRLANGFDKRQDWLEKEDAHIENAVSMAIDGSIYLLNSNGSIDKFRTGNKITEFSTESPSNPISSSAKIYTKPEFKYLYVSDPPQNRVVLFNKTSGKLAGQYTSDKFSDLKNIVVDAKEEKIYILSGNKVFKVGIEIEN